MRALWEKLCRIFRIQNQTVQIIFTLVIIGSLFFVFMISNVYTETYDIERFSNAKEIIRAPITIEDTKETEHRRREAVQAIEDRYSISSEITEERIDYVKELFDAVGTVLEKSSESDEEIQQSNVETVQDLKQLLTPEILDIITQNTLVKLVEASDSDRSVAKELLITSLYDAFNEGIRTEGMEESISNLNQKLRYSSLSNDLQTALIDIGEFAIVENSFFSVNDTMEAENQAINNVEPVMIRAGEVLVQEGQTITNELYEKLKLVGLLNSDRNVFPVIGLLILILLLLGLIFYDMNDFSKKQILDHRKLIGISLISVGIVGVMKSVSYFATNVNQLFFLVPIITGVLLLKLLFREKSAITFALVFSVIGSVIFNGQIPGSLNMEVGMYFLFSQLASIIFLMKIKDRSAILKASIGAAIANVLTVLLFLFLSYEKYVFLDYIVFSGYGLSAAFIACILTIGILPFFESELGILSDTKLLTLASPNHPVLRKILMEAPGTYHHSVMVANLSEAACENIGANGLLARVASYYHDLGKTKHPHFFIENQMGIQNPHDYLDPIESAKIIIDHPYDGAEMLRKHKLPKEIIDIAEQHHGTTLLKYFFYKEKESGKMIQESDYRYPGPRPRTKEAAVISICDSIEAAVRSIQEPSMKKIDEMITSIIQERLLDGQLDESSLTFKELDVIKTTVNESLNGIYHSRIQYPTGKKTKEA